jgi:hypothetical protein
MRDLTPERVLEALERNGCRVKDDYLILIPKIGPGIKMWGYLDYLVGNTYMRWRRME